MAAAAPIRREPSEQLKQPRSASGSAPASAGAVTAGARRVFITDNVARDDDPDNLEGI